jgi:hypothetical protein
MLIDGDCLNDPVRLGPGEIDRQQTMPEIRTCNFHAFCQHEDALELASGDAAMEVLAGLVVLLPPPDHELTFLDGDIELVAGETCDSQRDTQSLGLALIARQPFDIVRRIAIRAFDDTVEHALDLVKSEKEGAG